MLPLCNETDDLQVTYIPGLPAECGSPKKSAKRRKKKKNEGPTTSNLGRENGHRGSTSSESEVSLCLKKRRKDL